MAMLLVRIVRKKPFSIQQKNDTRNLRIFISRDDGFDKIDKSAQMEGRKINKLARWTRPLENFGKNKYILNALKL